MYETQHNGSEWFANYTKNAHIKNQNKTKQTQNTKAKITGKIMHI